MLTFFNSLITPSIKSSPNLVRSSYSVFIFAIFSSLNFAYPIKNTLFKITGESTLFFMYHVSPFLLTSIGNKNNGAFVNVLSLKYPSTKGYPMYNSYLPVSFSVLLISLKSALILLEYPDNFSCFLLNFSSSSCSLISNFCFISFTFSSEKFSAFFNVSIAFSLAFFCSFFSFFNSSLYHSNGSSNICNSLISLLLINSINSLLISSSNSLSLIISKALFLYNFFITRLLFLPLILINLVLYFSNISFILSPN